MLTADLALSWQRGGRTGPRYIERDDPKYLREAHDLIDLFSRHEGHTRAALNLALEEYVGLGTDYKILRGLIKLLMDRSVFEVAVPIAPAEIRRVLFLKARRHHPVIADDALRAEIAAEAAAELGCPPEVVRGGLYADLPENQKLVEFTRLTDGELIDLYNLGQAQALLYRCLEMRLWVEPMDTAGYRELFGAIKSYRLIHSIRGSSQTGYEIRLDGPVSLFHRSQKYGIQMAVFLPALLLCRGWRMRAEISLKPGSGGGAGTAFFEINSDQQQLRSHYLSGTAYDNPVLEKLIENWGRYDSPWQLARSGEVIDLGESAFIPDFVLRHPNGTRVYMEVLGFWTPRHLQARLREFAHNGMKNFIIAAWEELRGSRDSLARVPPHVIVFKSKLDPAAIELAAADALAGAE